MCIDARKTSTGVQNSKKTSARRYAVSWTMLPLGKKLDLPLACEVKMYFFFSCYCRAEKSTDFLSKILIFGV